MSDKFAVAGDVYAILATGEETAGAYSFIEAQVPPGGGPPPHTQQDLELFYVISGEVTFSLGDSEHTAGPGSYLRVEPGVLHAFKTGRLYRRPCSFRHFLPDSMRTFAKWASRSNQWTTTGNPRQRRLRN